VTDSQRRCRGLAAPGLHRGRRSTTTVTLAATVQRTAASRPRWAPPAP